MANAGTGEDDESTFGTWWLMPAVGHPFYADGDNLTLSVEWTISWLKCLGKEYGAFIGTGFFDHEHTRNHVWKLSTRNTRLIMRGKLSTEKHSLLRSQYPEVIMGVMAFLVCFENNANIQPKNCHVRQTWYLAFPLPRSSLPAAIRKKCEKNL